MKHITEEDVEILSCLVPAFGTATHLMRLRGATEEAESFEKDMRTLIAVIERVRTN